MGHCRPKARRSEEERPAIWVGYGRLVKLFRERARLTQQELAQQVDYSPEQIASVEQGRRPAKTAFTEAAERVLEAGGVLAALQEEVDRARLPAFFRDFAALEAEALSRFSYDPLLVPGLLQTEEYARAVLLGHCPALPDDIAEQQLEARVSRQQVLTRAPGVELSFVIGESVLRNPVGGTGVMREQCRRIAEVSALRNVEIQIMPAITGFHPGLDGPFVLVETTEHRRYGYVESQEVGTLVTDPAAVSFLGLRYGKLRSQALSAVDSAQLIEELAGEL
ncbi:helix-turn-helix domain-containing protein [Streptomyces hoynatensis]|uniref:XRE family transcriptional regulator n=1 Tax=Streptomyces hoynatensis TaxID=1141874 RepID=A0A3A9Z6N3_9ACTN|nr:helix-turn-helix transcriptional regulator [Streptomyces hoynatensis]RKN44011.1 XRE family transcriptional regulator [Streptomyces hoynatensis]